MILVRNDSPFGRIQVAPNIEQLAPDDAKAVSVILNSAFIKFMDHDLFKIPNARNYLFRGKYLLGFDLKGAQLSWETFFSRDWGVPTDTFAIKWKHFTPIKQHLFTSAQEKIAFMQFNYARFRVHSYQLQNAKKVLPDTKKRDLLYWHKLAETLAETITMANLGLVLAMSRNRKTDVISRDDLVADGKMALLRSVSAFDISRGFKFSTYGCRAIVQQYNRSIEAAAKYRNLVSVSLDTDSLRDFRGMDDNSPAKKYERDRVRRALSQKMKKAELSSDERQVLALRFPLYADPHEKPWTLLEVSKVIGLTKERIRQIQTKALEKMRKITDDELLEAV